MRTVDMRVIIPKALEVAKEHQNLQESGKVVQIMLGVEFQKQQEIEKRKVNFLTKSEKIDVTSEKERREDEKNKKREKPFKKSNTHIDVKV